ncbi:hypothetical protein [Sorangium atrum]|uniref:Uncharacterized protein n=1 Tax=Sorangium atrum TaxID=2995308 RepID=A0ABT5C4T4_9BACT|nr:hypothetical protein [Sorangium aterium]MDC0681431.1 hypothetical protein [Sorangium aterium]
MSRTELDDRGVDVRTERRVSARGRMPAHIQDGGAAPRALG